MKHYRSYMDAQRVSGRLHESLLELKKPTKKSVNWARWGALAACCALLLGVGAWRLTSTPGEHIDPPPSSAGQFTPGYVPKQGEKDVVEPEDLDTPPQPTYPSLNEYNFLADSGQEAEHLNAAMIPAVYFPEVGQKEGLVVSPVAPDYAYTVAVGSFSVGLTQGDISRLLGQKEGHGNVPWMLGWDGYTISGRAIYDPEGNLSTVTIWGVGEEDSFTLHMSPGVAPITYIIGGAVNAVTDVRGVEVHACQISYDYDGDGKPETEYECSFMAHDVGIRFTVEVDDSAFKETGAWRSELLVNWCTYEDCPLTLEHLLVNENVPAWRDEEYNSYASLLAEEEFAPYLPKSTPEGYGEFQGHLTYQEGNYNTARTLWRRGYDNVRVTVSLPEGEQTPVETIDVTRPETYDTRLYSIPWCDSVPEELMHYFLSPSVFRAQDMSLELVEARMTPHDTGGESCQFKVLHENGVLVSYSCDGLTAEQIWDMVEPTL